MLKIDYSENFEEINKMASKLFTEYDVKNKVEYNFKRFAFTAKIEKNQLDI